MATSKKNSKKVDTKKKNNKKMTKAEREYEELKNMSSKEIIEGLDEYKIETKTKRVKTASGKKITLGQKFINVFNGLDVDGKIRYISKVAFNDSSSAFRRMFLIFFFYSFIGTLAELFVEIVINHWYFMPREFFRLPICPIFGIGAVVLFMFFDNFLCDPKHSMWQKIIVVFVFSVIITSAIEYLTSYILELTTGTWPWKDYANQPFNLDGRICLFNSLGFGILSTFCILWIQPRFEYWLLVNVHFNKFNILFWIVFIAFVLDLYFAVKYPTGVDLSKPRTSWDESKPNYRDWEHRHDPIEVTNNKDTVILDDGSHLVYGDNYGKAFI